MRSRDLAKAIGLELRKPQGALAEGRCGLGREDTNRTDLEEGHSCQAKTTACHCAGFIVYWPSKIR